MHQFDILSSSNGNQDHVHSSRIRQGKLPWNPPNKFPTYTLLLPDNSSTTNQLLAYGFSSQFATSPVPAAFNGSFSSLLTYTNFTPPTSARWINALFFLSLVLSLAAAFFGILAKQWLREYMQWNSPLGAPRENVLVHQARFEAWEFWNIAATISSIPALLELAMVLFLIGVVILLWMIDNVVAIVVTVAIVAFLSLAIASTILPVFLKQCPYKSPTAWACVIAVKFISSVLSSFTLLYNTDREKSAYLRHWRGRDLHDTYSRTGKTGGWWSKSLDLRTAVRAELVEEIRPFNSGSQPFSPPPFLDLVNQSIPSEFEQETQVLRDIGYTTLLLRALSWVRVASQDVRVQEYVHEAADSIHEPSMFRNGFTALADSTACGDLMSQLRGQAMANRCMVASFLSTALSHPYIALFFRSPLKDLAPARGLLWPPCNTEWLLQMSGVQVQYTPTYQSWEVVIPRTFSDSELNKHLGGGYWRYLLRPTLSEEGTPFFPLICCVVFGQLKDTVAMLETTVSGTVARRLHSYELTQCCLVAYVAEFYSLLFALTTSWRRDSTDYGFLIDAWRLILYNKRIKNVIDTFCPQFRARILDSIIVSGCARVDVDSSGALAVDDIDQSNNVRADYKLLLNKLELDVTKCSPGDFACFICITTRYLKLYYRYPILPADDDHVTGFYKLVQLIKAYFDRSRQEPFKSKLDLDNFLNASVYISSHVADKAGILLAQRLSHAIEGLYHRGFLLIRTHTKTELQSLLTNTHRKVIDSESEQCTVAGCRWPRQGNHDVAAREPPASQEYPLDLLDPAPQTKAEDIYTAPTRREDTEDDRSIGSIEKHSRPRVDGSNLKIGTPRGDGEYIVVKSSELDYLSTTMKLTMPSPDRQRMVLVSWKLTRTTPPTPITPCLLRSCCCSQTTPTSWNSYSSPNSITVHPSPALLSTLSVDPIVEQWPVVHDETEPRVDEETDDSASAQVQPPVNIEPEASQLPRETNTDRANSGDTTANAVPSALPLACDVSSLFDVEEPDDGRH